MTSSDLKPGFYIAEKKGVRPMIVERTQDHWHYPTYLWSLELPTDLGYTLRPLNPAPVADEHHALLMKLRQLLTDTANALKGAPPELTQHDWSDLPKVAAALKGERDHWKANHDNQVSIKAAVLDRPDLGDRAKRVVALVAERDALKAAYDSELKHRPDQVQVADVPTTRGDAAIAALKRIRTESHWTTVHQIIDEVVGPPRIK